MENDEVNMGHRLTKANKSSIPAEFIETDVISDITSLTR